MNLERTRSVLAADRRVHRERVPAAHLAGLGPAALQPRRCRCLPPGEQADVGGERPQQEQDLRPGPEVEDGPGWDPLDRRAGVQCGGTGTEGGLLQHHLLNTSCLTSLTCPLTAMEHSGHLRGTRSLSALL